MSDLVHLTIDGKPVTAPAGTLVIDAAKQAGIEIPAFCYYEGLSLQAACRMCLVEVEKDCRSCRSAARFLSPKAWWCTPILRVVRQARKGTLEFLLTNHPLDCPVCDKGGECELQDMVFRYGAGESRFTETETCTSTKSNGRPWFSSMRRAASSATAACAFAMKAWAWARWASSTAARFREIAPNEHDHLECDECGVCIDICPGGRAHQRHLSL